VAINTFSHGPFACYKAFAAIRAGIASSDGDDGMLFVFIGTHPPFLRFRVAQSE